MDLRVGNDLPAVIYPRNLRTCFRIEALEDTIAENTEVVNFTVMPLNPNDRVMDGTVSVAIIDDDGT